MNIPFNSYDKLRKIWQEIGVSEDEQQNYVREITDSLERLLQQRIQQHTEVRDGYINENNRLEQTVYKLYELFGVQEKIYQNFNTLISKQTYLKNLVQELEKKRNEKMQEKKKLLSVLIEACDRLGCKEDKVEYEEEIANFNAPNSLAPEVFQKLESRLKKYEEMKNERMHLIANLRHEIKQYFRHLDTSPDTSHMQIDANITHHSLEQIDEYIWNTSPSEYPLTLEFITSLQERKVSLIEEEKRRFEQIEQLQLEINNKYERLGTPLIERETIIHTPTMDTITKLENIKEELERKMHEMIKELIGQAKEQLLNIYDELEITTPTIPLDDLEYTEDSLVKIETEIHRCETILKEHRRISVYVEKREILLDEYEQMKEWSKDPNRLLSKGRSDPGRLLKEEKIRNRMKKLPQHTQFIKQQILNFENQYKIPYYFNQIRYLNKIEEYEEEERRIEEEKRKIQEMKKLTLYTPRKRNESPTPSMNGRISPRTVSERNAPLSARSQTPRSQTTRSQTPRRAKSAQNRENQNVMNAQTPRKKLFTSPQTRQRKPLAQRN